MNRHLMVAGAVMALGLNACSEPPAPDASPKTQPVQTASAPLPPAVPPEPPKPKPPEWTYERNERYRDYHLIRQAGPAVPGREFEAEIMCKNVFDAADYNMWALQNLVVVRSRQGMTTFMGMIDNQLVEIAVVIDEERHVPIYLMESTSGIVASCEHSFAYP